MRGSGMKKTLLAREVNTSLTKKEVRPAKVCGWISPDGLGAKSDLIQCRGDPDS